MSWRLPPSGCSAPANRRRIATKNTKSHKKEDRDQRTPTRGTRTQDNRFPPGSGSHAPAWEPTLSRSAARAQRAIAVQRSHSGRRASDTGVPTQERGNEQTQDNTFFFFFFVSFC